MTYVFNDQQAECVLCGKIGRTAMMEVTWPEEGRPYAEHPACARKEYDTSREDLARAIERLATRLNDTHPDDIGGVFRNRITAVLCAYRRNQTTIKKERR